MSRRRERGFAALRVVGGLFPPEFLRRVADRRADFQADGEYDISKSLDFKEEMARFWRIATDAYDEYARRRQRRDVNHRDSTVNGWLLPLLRDVFGYRDVATARRIQVGERSFPVSHEVFSGSVPLVLVTSEHELDRSYGEYGDENRRRAPHGLMQEYLNANDNAIWGLVSNGDVLRLVRENRSLTRPAYIEADLRRIFEEQLYSDFVALWLFVHASRLEPMDGRASRCILEQWRKESHETGQRALADLRHGVQKALRQLGSGFLQHPDNKSLRSQLATGEVTTDEFFQELLRLIYRVLFLFTVEERDLLHTPDSRAEQRDVYTKGYSVTRLRERVQRRRHFDHHSDLWQSLVIVFQGLAKGAEPLGLPALGGLFSGDQCPNLDKALITNERLLLAIRSLTFFDTGGGLVRVNYRDMGTEELGSVYESLLELHPRIDVASEPMTFGFMSDENGSSDRGSARRLTGSYYTPASLVNELIGSALEPVMERAIADNPHEPRQALLDLRIIDPACGSGHFLLAAARRMAAEIARLDSGNDTPSEKAFQSALREVVRHCIYGVDINPLAVELCKTALWIEAVEPGKPLTFLDSHIQCGNALVGVLDPSIMAEGIPAAAFAVRTGDDRDVSRDLARKNRESVALRAKAAVQRHLFIERSKDDKGYSVDLASMPEETIADIEAKRAAWMARARDPEHARERLRADVFTAAFFAPKTKEMAAVVPITEDLTNIERGEGPRPGVADAVRRLAAKHRFFHWQLAFPAIMRRGGFDVVLGNPPWERIKLQEKEFFANRAPAIATARNAAERGRLINRLRAPDAPDYAKRLYEQFEQAKHESEASTAFVRESGRFPLTGKGDVNTYSVFTETALYLLNPSGRAGLVVPSGIASDNTTKDFFAHIVSNGKLVSLYDFENRERLFPDVDSRMKFCLLTMGDGIEAAEFVFFATNTEQLQDAERRFTLTAEDFALMNPNTRTAPVFRSRADAELTKKIYRRVPVFIDESKGKAGNPWGVRFGTMFHMANDAGLFRTFAEFERRGATRDGVNWVDGDEVWVPLYEAKMIHQFDHRWATYEEDGETTRDLTDEEKRNPNLEPLPRYWVPEEEVQRRLRDKGWQRNWLLGWRGITNATNERTLISSVFPVGGVGHSLMLLLTSPTALNLTACLYANLNSLVSDYVVRQKIGGANLTYHIMRQLPILPPGQYEPRDLNFIMPRVGELVCACKTLRTFASDAGGIDSIVAWNSRDRASLRAELDAYYAYLYGLTRDELRYVLDPSEIYGEDYPSETFRVLKTNEMRKYGEYRTRRLVLEAWDRLVDQGIIEPEGFGRAVS